MNKKSLVLSLSLLLSGVCVAAEVKQPLGTTMGPILPIAVRTSVTGELDDRGPVEVRTPVKGKVTKIGGMVYSDQTAHFVINPEFREGLSKLIKIYSFKGNPMTGYITFAGKRVANFTLKRPKEKAGAGEVLIGSLPNFSVYVSAADIGTKGKFALWWKENWARAKHAMGLGATKEEAQTLTGRPPLAP